jgi:hypothetical protein
MRTAGKLARRHLLSCEFLPVKSHSNLFKLQRQQAAIDLANDAQHVCELSGRSLKLLPYKVSAVHAMFD